jgi:fatty-acid desaturase
MAVFAENISTGHTPFSLRWSLAAGFVGFGVDLGASYVLQHHACAVDPTSIHVVTSICLAIALSGFALGWMQHRRLPHQSNEEGPKPHDRAHFQALLGMSLSAAFAVAILAEAVPRWILNACD